MSKIKLEILFNDKNGDDFKKVISYINPECDNDKLVAFVDELNALTTNKIKDIYKVVEHFLQGGDDSITTEELISILNGTFIPKVIDNPITDADILSIFSGDYSPTDDKFIADDFIF